MDKFNDCNAAVTKPDINLMVFGDGGSDGTNGDNGRGNVSGSGSSSGNVSGSGSSSRGSHAHQLATLSDLASSLSLGHSDDSLANLLNISGNANNHFATNILNMAAMMSDADDFECGNALNSLAALESGGKLSFPINYNNYLYSSNDYY